MPIEVVWGEFPNEEYPLQLSIKDTETGATSSSWQYTSEELLQVATTIFEKIIPIIHQKELDKIPF